MKRLILILLLFVLPVSMYAQSRYDLIRKEWVGPHLAFISFDSTTCRMDFYARYPSSARFIVKDDTLRFTTLEMPPPKPDLRKRGDCDFLIKLLTKDSLILTPINDKASKLVNAQPVLYYKDRLLTSTDTIRFDSLYFRSTTCYGTCPAMDFQINNKKELKFRGRDYAVKKGNFTGILTDSTYQKLLRALSMAELDQLKAWDQVVYDAPGYIILVWYNHKKKYISNYYLPEVTKELLSCLLSVPAETALKPSAKPLTLTDH